MNCSIDGCGKKATGKGFCSKHYTRFRLYGNTEAKSFDHEPIEIRFWLCVDKKAEHECWLWKRPASSNGYGRIRAGHRSKEVTAHRLSWVLHNNDEIPAGMVVMHKCDNKLCVNPYHLQLGTYKDNTQDMISKGRAKYKPLYGSTNGNALLDEEKVRLIKGSQESHAALARLLGVSASCIADIRKGRRWVHVV